MKTGIELIADERAAQVAREGWTTEHDDEHDEGEMAHAAAAYCMTADSTRAGRDNGEVWWPWHKKWFKPKGPVRDLVRAGALIAAEIDRLLRAGVPVDEAHPKESAAPEELIQTVSHYIKVASQGRELDSSNMRELEGALQAMIDEAVTRAVARMLPRPDPLGEALN